MTKQEAMNKLQELHSAEVDKAKAYSNEAAEYSSKYFSLRDVVESERKLNGVSCEYYRLMEERNEMLKKANDNHENAQKCYAVAGAYFDAFKILCEVA